MFYALDVTNELRFSHYAAENFSIDVSLQQ
jgi:hypothetical protein